jgi:hypothetical protein
MMALLFSFENLYRQYLACRRNKRNTLNALRFEARHEQNLLDLCDALQGRSYQPARSVCCVVKKPKLREIFAADFRDRVVHHVLAGMQGSDLELCMNYFRHFFEKNDQCGRVRCAYLLAVINDL